MPAGRIVKSARIALDASMRNASLGIALKLGATLAFSLMYASIRLAGTVPVGEVVFFRAAFAMVPLLALSLFTAGPRALFTTAQPFAHLRRAMSGVASMFVNFLALKMLPLADLTGLGFAMPIFAVVLASLLLHEQVGPFRSAAVIIGFAGVLLMVAPHGELFVTLRGGHALGASLALLGAGLGAFSIVFIRQMSATERSEAIVFYFMAVTALIGAVTMIWWRTALTGQMTAWLVVSGLLGGIGQIAMTYSYRYAEPSLLAPFDYAAMIWAVALGFFVFGEVPEPIVLAGALIVTVAGLFIAWRERRRERREDSASAAAG
jgi:drug/metabolite transporter (DMT)-like permease